ncbi:hypothetical protein CEXT_757171 [Caerostris extrusa]|uniref:Uncharacterized protein n=1 Tax=Caerostris extrusa TaxID=172846 RepID=A0AAV4V9B5_CAEEX|nr:hypothetical protein CEXT_757171 [Caerostris extrusa]
MISLQVVYVQIFRKILHPPRPTRLDLRELLEQSLSLIDNISQESLEIEHPPTSFYGEATGGGKRGAQGGLGTVGGTGLGQWYVELSGASGLSCFSETYCFSEMSARPADVGGGVIRVLWSLGAGEANVIDKVRG